MKTYQVNYLYTNAEARVLRDSIVVEAKDETAARVQAETILKGRHKVFKITVVAAW